MAEPCYSLYTEEMTECERREGNPWPPGLEPQHITFSEYSGPYPLQELNRARAVIINALYSTHRDIIERVKPKMGLTSAYGYGMVPPPPNTQRLTGTTQNSDTKRCLPVEAYGSPKRFALDSATSNHHMNEAHDAESSSGFRHQNKSGVEVCNSSSSGTSWTTAPSTMTSVDLYARYSTLNADGSPKQATHKPSTQTKRSSKAGLLSQVTASTSGLPQFHVYRCDYCPEVGGNHDEMQCHLRAAQHTTASLYSTDKVTGNIVAVEQMLACTHKCETKAVVTCPHCYHVFPDIFQCGLHYNMEHNSRVQSYSISQVIAQEVIRARSINVCSQCEEPCGLTKKLFRHWQKYPSHFPFTIPEYQDKLMLHFTCQACDMTFYRPGEKYTFAFYDCYNHVVEHERDTDMAITIRHILVSQNVSYVPLYNNSDTQCGLSSVPSKNEHRALLGKTRTMYKKMFGSQKAQRIKRINAELAKIG